MSEKSKSTTFLLCWFLGPFGAHRFYLQRWMSAVLMLLTLGGLGIWWLIDSVLIIGAKLNDADGRPLRTGPPQPDNPRAGFWVRLAAISVDTVIVQLAVFALGFVGSIGLGIGGIATLNADDPHAVERLLTASSTLMGILFVIMMPLYFGLQTASRHQATIGKRVFEICVSSNSGVRLSVGRSVWRSVCYLLSALPIFLGFVLAAFTRDKRALHDYLAGSRVLYVTHDSPATSPRPAALQPATAVVRDADAVSAKWKSSDVIIVALGVLLLTGATALALL